MVRKNPERYRTIAVAIELEISDLLDAVMRAEERSQRAIVQRAIAAYAAQSAELRHATAQQPRDTKKSKL